MTDDEDDIFDHEDHSHLSAGQRVAELNTRAGDLVGKVDELVDRGPHDWEPPQEGRKSDTRTFELTVREIEAIERRCRHRATSSFNDRGDNPTYRKYKYLAQKFGGPELSYHEDDD